jgi:hypothetical protein
VSFGPRWQLCPSLVADLKSAYLAAFALFGYRHGLDRRPAPISAQILERELETVQGAWWIATPDLVLTDPSVTLLRAPFPEVMVRMREALVFLPWTSSPPDFYERLRAHFGDGGAPADFGGTEYAWPKALILLWDWQFCGQSTKAGDDKPTPA